MPIPNHGTVWVTLFLCCFLQHHPLPCQGLNISLSAETTHIKPFLRLGEGHNLHGNPLYGFRGFRKGGDLGVMPLDPTLEKYPVIPLLLPAACNAKGCQQKPASGCVHFINQSHFSYMGGSFSFETEEFTTEDHRLNVVNIMNATSLAFVVPGTLHHDMRFYPETGTFFCALRTEGDDANVTVDQVRQVDTRGKTVWSWYPSKAKELPPCMKWTQRQNDKDCHHINAIHYVHEERMVYLSMRRLGGFIAIHRPTSEIRWIYSSGEHAGFRNGGVWLGLCPIRSAHWPADNCASFGYHGLHPLGDNHFSTFANCDSSARKFVITEGGSNNERCLDPVLYVSRPPPGTRRDGDRIFPS